MLSLIHDLIDSGFNSIIVVNDGSIAGCAPIFDEISKLAHCTVLTHAVNLGKGRALKTGFNYLLVNCFQLCGVVTCDADGQHLVKDIASVATSLSHNQGSLVLGVREFGSNVPLRSKMGNIITRGVFYFLVGKYLSDTQTGLRGIPLSLLPSLIKLSGEGYEYEMSMLIAAKTHHVPIIEENIHTIYIENNRSSHFNPLLDSMKIYFLLLRFSCSSIVASALDLVLFSISYKLTSNILFSIFLGRYAIGSLVNFYLNRKFVFHYKEHLFNTIVRYYLFVSLMGLTAYFLIQAVTSYFDISVIAAKLIVESFLFILSFTIQRDYIFSRQISNDSSQASSGNDK